MLNKTVKTLIPALIVLSAIAGVGFLFSEARRSRALASEDRPPVPEAPAVNVGVVTVRPEPEVRDLLELPAVVEANRVVRVSAEVEGRVERIPFAEGAMVKAGEPLALLNTDILQADYDRALAEVEYARRQYERMAELLKGGVATPEQEDQTTSTKKVAEAALAAAKARLERATILSPIDGILNSVPVEEGEYVKVGDIVAELVDVEIVKVVVQIPERDVGFFGTGAEAEVDIGTNGQKVVDGTITYISELADEHTRSSRMEITVKNNPRRLRSGQIVTARLTRRVLKDVIMIPLAAVIPLESGHAVYVAESQTAQRRTVRLGFIRGLQVEVAEGLKAGERLIVAGHRFVGPGQSVNVVTGEGEKAAAGGEGPPR